MHGLSSACLVRVRGEEGGCGRGATQPQPAPHHSRRVPLCLPVCLPSSLTLLEMQARLRQNSCPWNTWSPGKANTHVTLLKEPCEVAYPRLLGLVLWFFMVPSEEESLDCNVDGLEVECLFAWNLSQRHKRRWRDVLSISSPCSFILYVKKSLVM